MDSRPCFHRRLNYKGARCHLLVLPGFHENACGTKASAAANTNECIENKSRNVKTSIVVELVLHRAGFSMLFVFAVAEPVEIIYTENQLVILLS